MEQTYYEKNKAKILAREAKKRTDNPEMFREKWREQRKKQRLIILTPEQKAYKNKKQREANDRYKAKYPEKYAAKLKGMREYKAKVIKPKKVKAEPVIIITKSELYKQRINDIIQWMGEVSPLVPEFETKRKELDVLEFKLRNELDR